MPDLPVQSMPNGAGQLCFATHAACMASNASSCGSLAAGDCVFSEGFCRSGMAATGGFSYLCENGAGPRTLVQ